jgi:NAD(P)H-hydrate repair Nnr-like enzyme with NAD(P)H-hydrate epimerase domain
MQFFELTKRQLDAQSMAEYMTQLTYRIEDNELAVKLMRVAEKLSDLDALFGTKLDRDFDEQESALIKSVDIMMKRQKKTSSTTC